VDRPRSRPSPWSVTDDDSLRATARPHPDDDLPQVTHPFTCDRAEAHITPPNAGANLAPPVSEKDAGSVTAVGVPRLLSLAGGGVRWRRPSSARSDLDTMAQQCLTDDTPLLRASSAMTAAARSPTSG